MVAQPGRLQAAFTAGELDTLLHERTELKYFGTGAYRMENVLVHPQGGFSYRGGLRDVGEVPADAQRVFAFTASDGEAYDLVFRPGVFSAWSATAELQSVAIGALTAAMLPEITFAQQADTMILFHEDLEPVRIKHAGPTSWSTDLAPFVEIPRYDYGGVYGNGVAAVWQLEFVGLTNASSVFVLTVSQQDTVSIEYSSDMTVLATACQAAILDLPNVSAGLTVVSDSGGAGGTKLNITFSGTGNEGDGWAVSGRVINKSDAAILAFKTTPGEAPGEALISAARGWPACGAFYTQRLLIGGFKSLPGAWMASKLGEYYNYDERFDVANGPMLVPMDVPSGEKIQHIVPSRNLSIFTNRAEYWIAERGLSRTDAPNHVLASEYGTRAGVPVVQNEGGLLFANRDGGVIAEFRYTDVEGNYVSRDISLLGSHLLGDVIDQSLQQARRSTDGNRLSVVRGDGAGRISTVLREQDVTAFTRITTSGTFVATSVNGRNELMYIVARPDSRRLERLDSALLLDEATDFDLGAPGTVIGGLGRFNGRSIWVIGDNEVIGPLDVTGNQVTLPFAVTSGYLGTWSAPMVTTLPPPRTVGPNIVLKRRARIHSVHVSVEDTTSLAIGVNDQPLRDVPLHRYGEALADVPELLQPVTRTITIRGLRGSRVEPKVTIGQVRPGRITVRSIVVEARL